MFGGDYGGFGGGGYDNMDTGGGFMKSPEKNQRSDKKSRDKMSFVPLTVKQALKAEFVEDTFRIENTVLHTIKLIGTIESSELHTTVSHYLVHDTTGTITCKLWNEKDPVLNEKYAQCVPSTLVCVVGMLKDYDGKRHVQVVTMHPVTDWNQRTHHFLQTIFVHLQMTREPIPGSVVKQDFSHSFGTPAGSVPMDMSRGRRETVLVEGQEMQPHQNPEVTKLFAVIIRQFQGVDDEQGLNKSEILRNLQRQGLNPSSNVFNEAVRSLADQGHLYTTLDDETYACTLYL